MPPKKKKAGKKAKATKAPPEEVETQLVVSDEEVPDKELDLLTDLNEEFFNAAIKTIQVLMNANRQYEAQKIKKYADILHKLHRKYVDEVRENDELRPQIEGATNKLRISLELSNQTEEAVEELKKALGQAWRESDMMQIREQEIQEKLQEFMLKCEGLESKDEVAQDDAELGHLSKYKNIILRERDRLNGEVNDLEKRLQLQRYYSDNLEYINKNNEENMQKMATRLKVLETEKQNFEIKIRTLFSNLDEHKDMNARNLQRLETSQRELNDVHQKLQKKSAAFDSLKHQLEKTRGENMMNLRQVAKLEEEIKGLNKVQKENEDTIRALRLEDKVKANSIKQLANRYKKAQQDHSTASSKLYKQNRANHTLNEEIVRLKNSINALEKDLVTASQRYEDLRRLKENMQRERDTLRSDIVKLNNVMADLRHTIMLQSNTVDGLHLDVQKLNLKLDEAKVDISKAEKERDELAQQMETLLERIEYYQEQIKFKSEQVVDLTEKLTQKNHTLINVRKQLEAVHSEKMILKRTLEACTEERDNFRILQTKTNHQINQLTTEILQNHNKINSLNMMIERLNQEKKELQTELRNKENLLASVRADLKTLKLQNEGLLKTIAEDELKFMKISQQLSETQKEKNLVGLQMVRRNDEIVLIKDKMGIMQTALDQGQTQYNQRVEDIRLLKVEINNLQTERDCLSRALKSTADMREEIIRLQRTLNQERIKVRSLTEDAKTPTGVHRWRILKGEDPNKFHLIKKVQMLQRRNLKQELQKINMGNELNEANKTIDNLRRFIQQFPTSNCKQKLVELERKHRSQTKRMKALMADSVIDKIDIAKYKGAIECLKNYNEAHTQQQTATQQIVVTEETHSQYLITNLGNYMECCPFSSSSEGSEDDYTKLCSAYEDHLRQQQDGPIDNTPSIAPIQLIEEKVGTDDFYT